MLTLKYPYKKFPKRNRVSGAIVGEVGYPLVPIRVVYSHTVFGGGLLSALVDSGSDINLFPAEIGEDMEIRILKGNPLDINGIGNSCVKGYGHNLRILVDSYGFSCKIYFSYNQQIPILGRTGFFDHFKRVTFEEKDEIFELEY